LPCAFQAETSSKYSGPTLAIDPEIASSADNHVESENATGSQDPAAQKGNLTTTDLVVVNDYAEIDAVKLELIPISHAPPAVSLSPVFNFTFDVQQRQQEAESVSSFGLKIGAVVALASIAGVLFLAVIVNVAWFCCSKPSPSVILITHAKSVAFFRRAADVERDLAAGPSMMQGPGAEVLLQHLAVSSDDLQHQLEEKGFTKNRGGSFDFVTCTADVRETASFSLVADCCKSGEP
jgi:hypothetical protein